jgi:transcriptional regulator with XRE-family HTH domain
MTLGMPEQEDHRVGRRVRRLREQKGLSLRALAERCGLSINAISRIERDESSPTVSSLHRLATALRVPITAFFDSRGPQATVMVRRDRRLSTHGRGVTMESLGSGLPDQQIEPFLMTLGPGVVGAAEPITHAGEELVYCLEGELEYQVGGGWHRLEAGDSLLFQAEQPHLCRNIGDHPAVILLILQAVTDSALSRRRHLDL